VQGNAVPIEVSVCWLIVGGHLEGTFHKQIIAKYPPSLLSNVYTVGNIK